ncbi:uncharacterized protein LOC126843179 [Adelges cooleyi]|uniref:uncharacterized protein LOC126843179 n=1 Tax=Adelges cooleyi TaxID=133065 RepID=UPI00217F398B|nr:uncharacterized protein LOC126843179 [Adelges cooleyi]
MMLAKSNSFVLFVVIGDKPEISEGLSDTNFDPSLDNQPSNEATGCRNKIKKAAGNICKGVKNVVCACGTCIGELGYVYCANLKDDVEHKLQHLGSSSHHHHIHHINTMHRCHSCSHH